MAGMLDVLGKWYRDQCDGEWEHEWGITIETLDNPGWFVRIDLSATDLEGCAIPRLERQTSETDWILCFGQDNQFHGSGDPDKLEEIVTYFLSIAERANATNSDHA